MFRYQELLFIKLNGPVNPVFELAVAVLTAPFFRGAADFDDGEILFHELSDHPAMQTQTSQRV
ncbi:MAG: hypothetical protein R2860_14055 [Desulfobacterales bacterium]